MPRIKDFLPGAEPPREQEQPAPVSSGGLRELLGTPMIDTGDTQYYTIGALARALLRSANTMRTWEADGVIPKGFETNSGSRNGRRRLYTGRQILALRQLAEECEVLHDHRAVVKNSEFSRLAWVLFDHLKDAA